MLLGMYVVIVGCVVRILYNAMGWPSSWVGTMYREVVLIYTFISGSWIGAFGQCILLCDAVTDGGAGVWGAALCGGHWRFWFNCWCYFIRNRQNVSNKLNCFV